MFHGVGLYWPAHGYYCRKARGGDRRRGYQRSGGGGYQPREIAYHRAGYGGDVAGGYSPHSFLKLR